MELPKGQLLLILGTDFNKSSKDNMVKLLESRCKRPVIVWDIKDFNERMGRYTEKYSDLLDNPAKAIITNAINNTTNNDNDQTNKKNSLLELLKKKYKNEEITLVLGAGVSIDGGIPLWNDLNNKLLAKMISQITKNYAVGSLDKVIELAYNNKESSPIVQTRIIRSVFSDLEFAKLLRNVIYENKPQYNTKLINEITNICIPKRNHIGVQSIITYNFDDLIEKSLKKSHVLYKTIATENDFSELDKLSIYHVHGFLSSKANDKYDYNNLIFSEEDYHRVYRDSYSWSNIIQINAFRDSTCLFIGCSLTDPNLRRLLDVANRNNENPRHFAILKRKEILVNDDLDNEIVSFYKNLDQGLVEQYYSSMGLNIIWVNDYSEIPLILNSILN